MATEKVGIYRKYHGPIPKDASGKPLPKSEWPKRRPFRWAARWFGTGGRRFSKSFKSRKEAQRFAQTKQADVHGGAGDPPPKINLKDFVKEHEKLMRGNVAPSTLRMQLTVMKSLAQITGWRMLMNKVNTRDVEAWRAQRRQQGIAAATANRELRTLKRVFNIAVDRGYLAEEENPCRALSAIKVTRKRPPYCSPQQFASLYDSAPDAYWKAFVTTLYCTGLRLQEMLNLTWDDIDFQQGAVHVARKDRHDMVQAWQPKDHEMRTIPLPSQATGLLASWRSQAAEDCPYVFMVQQRWDYYRAQTALGQWREGQDLVNNVLRRFKTLCRRADIGSYSLHDMRRSCITNWARDLPIHVVQQLAGHSDMRTTQTYYLSVNDEDVEKAKRLQGKLLEQIGDGGKTDPLLTHFADFKGYRTKKPKSGKPQDAA